MKAEDIHIDYETALTVLPPPIRRKVEYSVRLIQKAERLAINYDSENGYYLAFSGGKDSQALFHIAQMAKVKFKAHMNATSVDPPAVIRFVRQEYPSVELIKPKDSIYNIAIKKQILPSMKVRWCCAEYKETSGAGKVTLIGIRHQESQRRAKRNEVEIDNRQYSGTLEGLEEYRGKLSDKKRKKNIHSLNMNNLTDEHAVGCISGKESILISPIIHWTEKDVWGFLNALNIPHCSLYDEGWKRLGCICCPMSNYKQKIHEIKLYPHVKRNWIKAIKAIRNGGGGFRDGYIWWNLKATEKLWRVERDISITQTQNIGFSDSSSFDSLTEEQKEDKIAEAIFDWWISGVSYKKWFANKYLQKEIDFEW